VAQAKRWRVLEFATPHCPFSTSKPDSGPEMAKWCPEWNERLMRWIHEHPELRTVFLSSHTRAPIVVPTGTSAYAERERGFLEKWNQLPPSVQRLIVIRDNPIGTGRTFDCVRTAIRKRKPAGRRCADPRSRALAPDAQVSAAAQVQGREVDVIDLTPHFCGRDVCLPVVGGVLVRKDVDHISQTFARTLGPYLLRGVDAALAG
jgi:hypothetical protein